jgi:hypothetical protein
MPQIVTANRLIDGDVVFRTADGGWSQKVDEAEVLLDKDTAAAAEAAGVRAVHENVVVDAMLIDVAVTDGHVVPTRLRERIRAYGPTTGNSLRKTA